MLARCTRRIGPALFAVVLSASPLAAQDSTLASEIERLRRDMNTLQAYVFRGEKKAGLPASGGPGELASQDSVSQLQIQVQELQRRMREMNGTLEEAQHRIGSIAERLDKLVADVDLRLRTIEEGRTPAPPNRQSRAPADTPPQETTIISGDSQPKAGSPGSGLPAGQQPFGALSRSDLAQYKSTGAVNPAAGGPPATPGAAGISKQTARQATAAPPLAAPSPPPVNAASPQAAGDAAQLASLNHGTPKEQYDHAYDLLLRRDLPKAEVALRAFVDHHPKHELAGNAIYWLGETFYARKNFPEAIKIYYQAYKSYPKGNKAPDVLLKLGMSLGSIGEKESACSAFDELAKAHPKANPRILGTAKRERQSLGCK